MSSIDFLLPLGVDCLLAQRPLRFRCTSPQSLTNQSDTLVHCFNIYRHKNNEECYNGHVSTRDFLNDSNITAGNQLRKRKTRFQQESKGSNLTPTVDGQKHAPPKQPWFRIKFQSGAGFRPTTVANSKTRGKPDHAFCLVVSLSRQLEEPARSAFCSSSSSKGSVFAEKMSSSSMGACQNQHSQWAVVSVPLLWMHKTRNLHGCPKCPFRGLMIFLVICPSAHPTAPSRAKHPKVRLEHISSRVSSSERTATIISLPELIGPNKKKNTQTTVGPNANKIKHQNSGSEFY